MSQPDPSFLLSAGVAQVVQRMPAAAFENKLRWFESHYRQSSETAAPDENQNPVFQL
jgi:hypothetical protein